MHKRATVDWLSATGQGKLFDYHIRVSSFQSSVYIWNACLGVKTTFDKEEEILIAHSSQTAWTMQTEEVNSQIVEKWKALTMNPGIPLFTSWPQWYAFGQRYGKWKRVVLDTGPLPPGPLCAFGAFQATMEFSLCAAASGCSMWTQEWSLCQCMEELCWLQVREYTTHFFQNSLTVKQIVNTNHICYAPCSKCSTGSMLFTISTSVNYWRYGILITFWKFR